MEFLKFYHVNSCGYSHPSLMLYFFLKHNNRVWRITEYLILCHCYSPKERHQGVALILHNAVVENPETDFVSPVTLAQHIWSQSLSIQSSLSYSSSGTVSPKPCMLFLIFRLFLISQHSSKNLEDKTKILVAWPYGVISEKKQYSEQWHTPSLG